MSSTSLSIRPATRQELEAAATVIRKAGLKLTASVTDFGTADGTDLDVGAVLVAVDGATVVGTAWAKNRVAEAGQMQFPVWCLEALAVRASHRTKGVGSALLQRLVEVAATAGVDLLYANCGEELGPYYEARGFGTLDVGYSLAIYGPDAAPILTADPDQIFVGVLPATGEPLTAEDQRTPVGLQLVRGPKSEAALRHFGRDAHGRARS